MKEIKYYVFLFTFCFTIIRGYIVFPLKKIIDDDYDYIPYYSNLYIGNPPQKTPVLFMSSNSQFILMTNEQSSFSLTYGYKSYNSKTFLVLNESEYKAVDSFYFLENKNDLSELYSKENSYLIDFNKLKKFKNISFSYQNYGNTNNS